MTSNCGLRLTFLRELLEQLHRQCLRHSGTNLLALAAHAGGDGEYVPRHPVRSPIRLAIDLTGYRDAWHNLFHCVTRKDGFTQVYSSGEKEKARTLPRRA